MKLTLLLSFLVLASFGNGFTQVTLSLRFSNANVQDVLKSIEEKTNYIFMYKDEIFDASKKISVDFKDAKFEQVLKSVCEQSDVAYEVRERQIILKENVKVPALPEQQQPQKKSISGKVTDEKGQPLPGVSVVVKGTTIGITTDNDGNYALEVPVDANTLSISFVGMKTQEITVDGKKIINVTLAEETVGIEEVVAVAYGTQKNRTITSAVSQINSDKIKNEKTATIDMALIGKIAGVNIKQTTGQPGGGLVVRIRGDASVSTNNMPLYIVDGMPVQPSYNEESNPLSLINPNDIESISVLKDAASASLYGSRASNGVILITTKKGKIGKSSINVNYNYGIQQYHPHSKIDVLNASQFAQYAIDQASYALTSQGKPVPPDNSHVAPEYRDPASLGEGTDWFDQVTQIAPTQEIGVSLSAGNQMTQSFFSVGSLSQDGIIKGTDYQRITARANINTKFNDYISAGVQVSPTMTKSNDQPVSGPTWAGYSIMSSVYQASPLVTPYDENGNLRPSIVSPGTFDYPNPLYLINKLENTRTNFNNLANAFVTITPIKELNLKSAINTNYVSGTTDFWRPQNVYAWLGQAAPLDPMREINKFSQFNWAFENTAVYDKTFKESHNLNILAGATVEETQYEGDNARSFRQPDDLVNTLNAGVDPQVSSYSGTHRLISYLARVNYSFKDKYLLSLAMRRDGDSRFGPNNKWGNFPSVSAGWRVSDEDFFQSIEFIKDLKLRASYGYTGNNQIGDYQYYANVGSRNYTLDNGILQGKSLTSFQNYDLSWERSQQTDIGIDMSMLEGRIALSADFYNKLTNDMLFNIPVATASGFGSALTNIGKMKNVGFEVLLNTKNTVGAFKWETDLTLTINRNTFLEGNSSNDNIDGAWTTTIVGYPISMFKGRIWDGNYNNQAEFDKGPRISTLGWTGVGGPRFLDANGDGLVDLDGRDEVPMGNPEPNFTYGFTNRFYYKNFDMNILINGQVGGYIMNPTYQWYYLFEGPLVNQSADVLERWKSPEDIGKGKMPVASSASIPYRSSQSEWMSKNSYLWVRNITLGYTMPAQALAKLKFIQGLRIYASAQNTFLLASYKMGMPEASTGNGMNFHSDGRGSGGGSGGGSNTEQGLDHNSYPVPYTIQFGVNVTF